MPRVTIKVGDLKCIQQADSVGRDDVYWVANIRSAATVDQAHTDLTSIAFDDAYASSLPEMVSIGARQTQRFNNSTAYDKDVPAGSYVFGTIHFLERDTPLSNYLAKIVSLLSIVIGGLVIAAIVGAAIGYAFAAVQGAVIGAIIAAAAVGLVGFFVGAMIELIRPEENDAHLGGMRIMVGPLKPPPPNADNETWQLTMTPAGKLEVVDAHGAELVVYESSHRTHAVRGGHRYETTVRLEVSGGHR
jgi:hypothetical protein